MDPVRTERGLMLVPTVTCDECPPLDVIVIPGGPGQQGLIHDEAVLGFLCRQAEQASYVTSVCTGALVLGAAGLLRVIGRRPIGSACRCFGFTVRCRSPSGSWSIAIG